MGGEVGVDVDESGEAQRLARRRKRKWWRGMMTLEVFFGAVRLWW
jgi:hypothetical protein